MGSPIYAADGGVVVYAGWMNGGYGNVVIIDHNNGYVTVYAHLSAIYVNCGNAVRRVRKSAQPAAPEIQPERSAL
jgi:murein DD-endopeptidase MepM/ murein hydrolase activator NlpD